MYNLCISDNINISPYGTPEPVRHYEFAWLSENAKAPGRGTHLIFIVQLLVFLYSVLLLN